MNLADAIIYGDIEQVRALLEAGADPREVDVYGYTPLTEAAIMRKTDIAKLLLEQNVDVDQQDMTGRSALYWAAETNNLPLAKLLLKHKADPNLYTLASEPPLANPLLRNQQRMKRVLYDNGASLLFAKDFINSKLIGHRFELTSNIELVNHENNMIELDFEGFFLEFTLSLISHSLKRFRNNFGARNLRHYFDAADKVASTLDHAAKLIKYQHYTTDLEKQRKRIQRLIKHDPLIIPVAYEGHAICFIHHQGLFAKCDRGEQGKKYGSVTIYQVGNPKALDYDFLTNIMYIKQDKHFIEQVVNTRLGLKPIGQLPISPQISGNCSWANVEATIPTLMTMLWEKEKVKPSKKSNKENLSHSEQAMDFYTGWLEWDRDRAIEECLSDFEKAIPARQASKISILGNIIFQRCNYRNKKDIHRAEKMLPYLTLPKYDYVIKSYIEIYAHRNHTEEGKNLLRLLDICGYAIDL